MGSTPITPTKVKFMNAEHFRKKLIREGFRFQNEWNFEIKLCYENDLGFKFYLYNGYIKFENKSKKLSAFDVMARRFYDS